MKKQLFILFLFGVFTLQNITAQQDGMLDESFGNNGVLRVHGHQINNTYVYGSAVDKQGRIIVTGRRQLDSQNYPAQTFYMLRYNTDGSPDTLFNKQVNTFHTEKANRLSRELGSSVFVDEFDKIYVGNKVFGLFGVGRFNNNGTLDTTFGASVNYKGVAYDGGHQWVSAVGTLSKNRNFVLASGTESYHYLKIVSFDKYGLPFINKSYYKNGEVKLDAGKQIATDNSNNIFIGTDKNQIVKLFEDGVRDTNFADKGVFNLRNIQDLQTDSANRLIFLHFSGVTQVKRLNTNGVIDSSFGINGIAQIREIPFKSKMKIDRENRIIVTGIINKPNNENGFITVRLTADGNIDSTFGNEGVVYYPIEEPKSISNLSFDGNNNLFVVGNIEDDAGDNNLFILKITSNGTIDKSFGNEGSLTHKFLNIGSTYLKAFDVNNKSELVMSINAFGRKDFIIRYDSKGQLNNSYGDSGRINIRDFNISSIKMDNYGKLLFTGSYESSSPSGIIFRYDFQGSNPIDESFGTNGRTYINYGMGHVVNWSLLTLPSNDILLLSSSRREKIFISKFMADGTIDRGFGDNGSIQNHNNDYDLYLPPQISYDLENNIIISGLVVYPSYPDTIKFFLVKYKSDGKIDLNFGDDGYFRTSENYRIPPIYTSENKIIFTILKSNNNVHRMSPSLTRLNTDGSVDTTFGEKGLVVVNYDYESKIVSMRKDKNQRIYLLCNTPGNYNPDRYFIIRFNNNGIIDSSFGENGALLSTMNERNIGREMKIDNNGDLLIAGEIWNGNVWEVFVTKHEVLYPVSIEPNNISTIKNYSLSQNYPNPFNPTTTISYSLPSIIKREGLREGFNVTLKVYDVLGKEVATLVNEKKPSGNYEVTFDGSHLTSGIYFYSLTSGNFKETKKLILLK